MDNNSKITAAKIVSMMERMDTHQTYNAAMLNESQIILESTRVTADSFLEFLTKNMIHKGPFVQLGYLQIYPTDTAYPTDDYYKAMSDTRSEFTDNSRNLGRFDQYMDKVSNSEWNMPTGRKKPNSDIKAMKNKLYPYVLKLTNYTLHWQTYNDYAKKSSDAYNELDAIKGQMSDDTRSKLFGAPRAKSNSGYYPIGAAGNYDILTFGDKDDNGNYTAKSQEYLTDPDNPDSKVLYDRTAIRNFLSDIKPQRPVYFGVDENGNIDPIPKSLGKLLYNPSISHDSKLVQISDPNEIALAKKYFDLEDKNGMANKTFLLQNVAYICGVATEAGGKKRSVYWVNKNPLFLLTRQKQVNKVKTTFKYLFNNMNNDELQEIINRYARSETDELMAMANTNAQGQTIYANPDDLAV